ncbi:putative transmembrane exo/endo phosphatase protein [Pseudorhizobium banfieldiae]|uniref:Putative transmembrane exo/endo phosphatase protein n=1 Tax=Pseudorhizobium banfieldiae TaxID=1125847 RepID=L0NG49_9HYPH|nr:endonuclease/exonuclease/phosphatase family protein [Pseudorhizobium banfieldiae]CAD6614578.1 endonuclease [arsenite-oxidising bacterium NT-25]CAD6617666.1 endonuclease [Rhizobium sp. TCK]CCF20068.1 putative transmembrane exo/endo phosphatase protein [Pseudorhizobium banfieldiae]
MRYFLSVAICVIVSLVILIAAARYVGDIWIFAAIGSLQLHLAVTCILAAVAAFVLHRSLLPVLLLAASLALGLHALWMTREMVQQPLVGDNAAAPALRLMSFNILSKNRENAGAIRDLILASGADVVNVLEAMPLRGELDALSRIYPHRIGCGEMTKTCDLMVLSKTPLTSPSVHSLSTIFENRMILSDLSWQGRIVHLAAIHTTKPYFDDFQTLELTNAARRLDRIEGPLLVAGDFNASSLAPNIRMFLRWTGLRTASWEPPTWPDWGGWLGVPIDHVYVRKPLHIRSLQRLPSSLGSNHYGLVADIVLAP